MHSGEIVMIILIIIGIFSRTNLIANCACILLVIQLCQLDNTLPSIETVGIDIGQLFLLLAILSPVALEKVSGRELLYNFTSLPGILAIIGGALATHLNGQGLSLLQIEPKILFGLIIGSVIGILFLGGQPAGPLMAAGITALFLEVVTWFT